ncbi:type II toxin-antitoxin system RelE/ParE family toxin [Nostoc edaphicum CCNP1411]|uniref:Type II toxin-antitoxin system RelE/ParE family toxin n=1 Tax=Nostoc edaphicum CCNP1411 TaxID=1472755 RepID=A0A7D7QDI8_9NOSO|nr:type II toxin-antitoxin system RelE/ParE family toxin [Nostoc edaphicum]QMS88699.1 type II toxin-antitoxin system RelE/ParE family toxin [Nostoc edaphicum CCNP1411]
MNRYIISLPASRDLQAIADYFAVENVEAGEQLLYAFNQKCQQLVSFPNMGRKYEDLRPNLRGLPLDGYIIFYMIIGEGIEIVRVVSGRRNLKSLFANPEKM